MTEVPYPFPKSHDQSLTLPFPRCTPDFPPILVPSLPSFHFRISPPFQQCVPPTGLSQDTVMWLTTQSSLRAQSADVVDFENSSHIEESPAQCSLDMHAMEDPANLPQVKT